MYNRYIPNGRGSFDRQRVNTPSPAPKSQPKPQPAPPIHACAPQMNTPKTCPPAKSPLSFLKLPERLDSGDLLVILIFLLLLQESDEDPLTLLLTLGAFLLLQ